MIFRIVKMTFKPEYSDTFEEFARSIKSQIASVPGCLHLEMLRDFSDTNTFFTYSNWESETDLNNYRKSELFGQVWPRTKLWFAQKPEAWTVLSLE